MSETRFPFGLAFGRLNNFFARTDNVFTESDTTPDVTTGNLFYTNNTSATAISYFDLTVPGGGAASNAGLFEGKVFWLVHLDSQTSFTRSAVLESGRGTFNPPSQSVTSWVFHNSAWYECSRGVGPQGNQTVTINAAGTSTVNVKDASVVLLNGTDGTTLVVHQFTNAEPGQIVTVIPNSGGTTYQFTNSSGNIHIGNTANFVAVLTSAYQFVSRDGTIFSMVSPFA